MNRIVTFGSCLSRYIARSYKRLYAGDIVSSVYHNRSDYFVECFLENSKQPIDKEFISSLLINKEKNDESIGILQNQTFDSCGKHLLDVQASIFDTIESGNYDLVFIDNFMDVASKLGLLQGKNFFIRPKDLVNTKIEYDTYINTDESVINFKKIINFFQKNNPNAKIVFIHFPYNTYENDIARKDRSIDFFKKFNNENTIIIPPQSIPKIYRTSVNSHFEEAQYCAYAGMIRVLTQKY